MNKKTVRDIVLDGKRVLMRVDFNVPIQDGVITDDQRVEASIPTIKYILEGRGRLILMSHLGRPKGGADPKFSLRPVAAHLGKRLGMEVTMAPAVVGERVRDMANALQPGEILMLENTRFEAGEETNDARLAAEFAALGDVYVNDAFGSAHRAHASTEGVARLLPGVAGLLMEKELEYLGAATSNPDHPYVVILGGAKVSDKIGVIKHLLAKADRMLLGGGMANTFLAAQGHAMRDSLVEADVVEEAGALLRASGDRIELPVDAVLGDRFDAAANTQVVAVDAIPPGWRILDIGPQTVERFTAALHGARLIVWNGPMGVFEWPNFASGTFAIARALAASPATTIVGGGDSASSVAQAGVADKVTHVSTGGGASLEFLEGRILPGVAALQDKQL